MVKNIRTAVNNGGFSNAAMNEPIAKKIKNKPEAPLKSHHRRPGMVIRLAGTLMRVELWF